MGGLQTRLTLQGINRSLGPSTIALQIEIASTDPDGMYHSTTTPRRRHYRSYAATICRRKCLPGSSSLQTASSPQHSHSATKLVCVSTARPYSASFLQLHLLQCSPDKPELQPLLYVSLPWYSFSISFVAARGPADHSVQQHVQRSTNDAPGPRKTWLLSPKRGAKIWSGRGGASSRIGSKFSYVAGG